MKKTCTSCDHDFGVELFRCEGCHECVCEVCAEYSAYFNERVCPDCCDFPPDVDYGYVKVPAESPGENTEAGCYTIKHRIVDLKSKEPLGSFLGWKVIPDRGFVAKIQRKDGTIDYIKPDKFRFADGRAA